MHHSSVSQVRACQRAFRWDPGVAPRHSVHVAADARVDRYMMADAYVVYMARRTESYMSATQRKIKLLAIEEEITHLELELYRNGVGCFVAGSMTNDQKLTHSTLFETNVLKPALEHIDSTFTTEKVNPSVIENELKQEQKPKGAMASITGTFRALTQSTDDDLQAWKVSNGTTTAYALLLCHDKKIAVSIISANTLTQHLASHKELEMKPLWSPNEKPTGNAEFEIFKNGVIELFNKEIQGYPPPPNITGP